MDARTKEVYEALLECDIKIKSAIPEHPETPREQINVSHAYPLTQTARIHLENKLGIFILPNGSYEIWGSIKEVKSYLTSYNLKVSICAEQNE